MAMAGESSLLDNASLFLPDQPLVYDWLTNHKVSWCAYQAGNFLPFFSLMASWFSEIVTSLTLSAVAGGRGRFRRYDRFRSEWCGNGAMPNVIFVEPEYTDGPHKTPNDDHPPTGVGPGQALLADLYETLISNPARWARTLLIVTYDEHGGFFDHVPPLPISDVIAGQNIGTTGVRVPAFLISPYVAPGSVFSGRFDHTSILQFLAERFAPTEGYSIAVNNRQPTLNRISQALTETASIAATTPPVPPAPTQLAALPSPTAASSAPPTANAAALDSAVRKIATDHPEMLEDAGWENVRAYLATVPAPIPAR
jgi:phospholipase C